MRTNRTPNSAKRPPAFVARAERAFGRVARKVSRGESETWIVARRLAERKGQRKSSPRVRLNPLSQRQSAFRNHGELVVIHSRIAPEGIRRSDKKELQPVRETSANVRFDWQF